ncbi:deoxyribose-phosphate aldolase [Pyronema domesticum]|uniref:deoxyribose-phosphate aldolase n=1 Tax=Pyronema omphalodes (strain CBS 100304) TaxID=1076935 RepID=U4L3T5_PYROM|nr:deoxyribose-phosphate aldolase [Pyronema domesticum]CCX10826.1 Similar to Deoxyribose-phosphate aldolase; acc. no. A4IR26 [Pyronema omphalodes CBS 100304]
MPSQDWPTFLPARIETVLALPPLAAAAIPDSLASYIDHTLLAPSATPAQVKALCAEAKAHSFASACINPAHVSLARHELLNTPVRVCAVIGFPLGANSSLTKAFETRTAVSEGADEVDMVINVGYLKEKLYSKIYEDVVSVVMAAQGRTVKVIIETHLLTDEEKVAACLISAEAGAGFVKTSTGFNGGGATVEDVQLMKKTVENYKTVKVKASGGVRDGETARRMVEAGAERIGTSSGVKIMAGGVGTGY